MPFWSLKMRVSLVWQRGWSGSNLGTAMICLAAKSKRLQIDVEIGLGTRTAEMETGRLAIDYFLSTYSITYAPK